MNTKPLNLNAERKITEEEYSQLGKSINDKSLLELAQHSINYRNMIFEELENALFDVQRKEGWTKKIIRHKDHIKIYFSNGSVYQQDKLKLKKRKKNEH